MRDLTTWAFPIGRLLGATIRVHILLPIVMLGLVLRTTSSPNAYPGVWMDAVAVMAVMWVSILLHEFGHVFAARAAGGSSDEILMWPLGGLAFADLPPTPRAHLVFTAGGPAVTALLVVASTTFLLAMGIVPPWNLFDPQNSPINPHLTLIGGGDAALTGAVKLAVRVFWLNWAGLLLNALPAIPLDGGRALQEILWWRSGDQRQATTTAAYVGLAVMLGIGIVAIAGNEILFAALAVWIYTTCRSELMAQETTGEDAPFGYDFSQGYTSLERDPPAAPVKKPPASFWQRWKQQRAAKKAKQEIAAREAEERRMEELLEKVHQMGLQSLNDEERRFMTRVSARYRGNKS